MLSKVPLLLQNKSINLVIKLDLPLQLGATQSDLNKVSKWCKE
jgi:hypothetical protein